MRDRLKPQGRTRVLGPAWALVGCLVGLGILAGQPRALAQTTGNVTEGRELFNTYCATCHGRTGAGNGPVAPSMRRRPPDITNLALSNGGVFPVDRLSRIIDGREVESHGDRAMPVWGDAFKAMRDGHSEESVRARINAILAYLASIQKQRA